MNWLDKYKEWLEGLPYGCGASKREAFRAGWEADRWISVEDELPEVGVRVRVIGRQRTINNTLAKPQEFHARYRINNTIEPQWSGFIRDGEVLVETVTHWQPLPEPLED